MNDDSVSLELWALVMFGLALIATFTYFTTRQQSYTDGYCEALGGHRVTNYVCDVNGKIVRP